MAAPEQVDKTIAAPFVVLCPAVSIQIPGAMLATTGVPTGVAPETVLLVWTETRPMTCEGVANVEVWLDTETEDEDEGRMLRPAEGAPLLVDFVLLMTVETVEEELPKVLFTVMVIIVVGEVLTLGLVVETMGLPVAELVVVTPAKFQI